VTSDGFKVAVFLLTVVAIFGWSACGGGDIAEPTWSVVYELRDGGHD